MKALEVPANEIAIVMEGEGADVVVKAEPSP